MIDFPARHRLLMLMGLICSLLLVAACTVEPVPASNTAAPTIEVTAPVPAAPKTTVEATASVATTVVATTVPTSAQVAAPPVSLRIAEIEMEVEISPLTWRVSEVEGKRTTIWVLPSEGAGWHPNSAGVGAVGNMIISGNQLLGDAAFAPIALGDVEVGQEIEVTDSNGNVFVYTVINVTEPLPLTNNLQEEESLAETYLGQGNQSLLTLVTGWPDFSSTARVIVIAELTAAE